MRTHPWGDIKKRKPRAPEQVAAGERWVEKRLVDMNLRKLRKYTGKTQAELAEIAKMSQSELSRVEARSDHMVSTLRRVVKAMGGKLEVVAVFDDHRIRLTGV